MIEDNDKEKQEIEDNNKLVNFLIKFIISKKKGRENVYDDDDNFLFYQITERNKILINFIEFKNEEKEENKNKKKNFLGGFFSNTEKKEKQKKFERIRMFPTFEDKINVFMDFHKTVYELFITKLLKIVHKQENLKISSEVIKMTELLNNSMKLEHFNKITSKRNL